MWEDRFWDKVAVPSEDECWEWIGYRAVRGGYGSFNINQVARKAHRLAYELCYGVYPGAQWVLHSCDNPPCVNPAHLRLGSVADNVQDMLDRDRHFAPKRGVTHCKWGHEFDEANTYVAKAGNRMCRKCCAERQRRYHAKRGTK